MKAIRPTASYMKRHRVIAPALLVCCGGEERCDRQRRVDQPWNPDTHERR